MATKIFEIHGYRQSQSGFGGGRDASTDDFGAEFTPELHEQEDRIRAQAEKLQKS